MRAKLFCDLGIGAGHTISRVGETPVDPDVVAKINRAVDECLDRCLNSSTPGHLTLEGFCRDLQNNPAWTSEEIGNVRSIVLRLLAEKT
jgi:hypothetical protein